MCQTGDHGDSIPLAEEAGATAGRPNILILLMDTARADHMSVYGYARATTPRLERFAAERAAVFTQAISAACWTVPSHGSLFTGLYPSEHGANDLELPNDCGPTLAEILNGAGYHTVFICNNPAAAKMSGFARGFGVCQEPWQDWEAWKTSPSRLKLLKRRGLRALGLLDSGAQEANRRLREALLACPRPFLAFANYVEPHTPYLPPLPFAGRFSKLPQALLRRAFLAARVIKEGAFNALGTAPESLIELARDQYDGEIAYLDERIGKLLDWMEESRLLDETIVIVTADHGENLGEHGLVSHHLCLYDTLIRVPLMIAWPDALAPGTTVSAQVQLTDLLHSICRLIGVEVPHEARAVNRPYVFDQAQMSARAWPAYAESFVPQIFRKRPRTRGKTFNLAPFLRDQRALRKDGYKYVESSDGTRELYDLQSDPREERNLAAGQPKLVGTFAEELQKLSRGMRKYVGRELSPDEQAALEGRLRDLGYV